MTKPNDGGPAFARPAFFSPEPQFDADHAQQDGMSLRDYFAAKAMHALARHDAMNGDEFGWSAPDVVALHAYKYADAMIRAREATR